MLLKIGRRARLPLQRHPTRPAQKQPIQPEPPKLRRMSHQLSPERRKRLHRRRL
jgi:hypothetical protein